MAITITKRPFKLSFSGNPVHYELTSALAATNADIYFEIRLMFRPVNNGSFTEVHRWPFYPTAGIAEISVHDLLHSKLEWQMPAWLPNELQPQDARQQTGEYYIEFREITPTDQTPNWDTTETDFICTVVRGGINYFQWRGNNYWVNYHQVKKPFLTWQESGRKAQPIERMFLGWLNTNQMPDGVALSAEIRCKVTFTDGTSQTLSQLFVPQYHIFYFIPSGFLQWNLGAVDPAKNIHYWEIFIVDVGDPMNPQQLSELFKYELDNRWSLNDITLNYRSSLGGIDSVTVRGVLDQNLDYQFTTQNRTFRADYFDSHVITAQTIITETREQQTWKGDIGHLGKEEQDRLRDAQLLRDVYMPSGNKWFPVNIVTKNFKLRSTGDMRFTMPIEFTLAYEGAEYYTPKSIDLGDGVFTSNVCLATLNNFLVVSKDFNASPPDCEITITGTENDPQNASLKFRYSLNGGAWVEKNYTDLPLTLLLPVDTDYILDYQTICANDVYGKKMSLSFDTYQVVQPPPPGPPPVTVTEVSNSGTPGSTRTQVEEYNGVNMYDALPALLEFGVGVYSHNVTVVSDGTQSLNDMLNALVAAINATSAADWNEFGSAPASGTPGFKPSASHTNGSNRITLVLNYGNQFASWVYWQ